MNKVEYSNLKIISGGGSLRLRPIQDNDTKDIIRWRNNEAIKSQFIFRELLTVEMHKEWLREKVYPGNAIQYIIENDGRSVGSVYLRDIDLHNESAEFGIFIGESEKTGKGLGTLSTELFTQDCFEMGFHRIFLRVLDSNYIAKACYHKAGFEVEGTAKDMVIIDGVWRSVTFMSKLNATP